MTRISSSTRLHATIALAGVASLILATGAVAVPVMDFGAFVMNIQHLKTDKKKDSELNGILKNYQTMNATLGGPGRPSYSPSDFLSQAATAPDQGPSLEQLLPADIAQSKSAALNASAAVGRREYASSLVSAVSAEIVAAKAKPDAAGVQAALTKLGLGELNKNAPLVEALTKDVNGGNGLANLQPLRDFFERIPAPGKAKEPQAAGMDKTAQEKPAAPKAFKDLRAAAKERFYALDSATLSPEMQEAYRNTRLTAQRAAITDALASATTAGNTAGMSASERQKRLAAKMMASGNLRQDIQANTSPTLSTGQAHARMDAAAALLLQLQAGERLVKDVEISPARIGEN